VTPAGAVACDAVTPFRVCPRFNPWPRRGDRWTPAEDERLLRLVAEALVRYLGATVYRLSRTGKSPSQDVARALGRTACAVQTRYQTLSVCRRRGC
jgi:hypothetical protein